MRKNKKLLLASVAALGALAIGVGATSTFAWFSLSNTTVSAGTDPTGTVQASADSVTLGSFTVTGRITAGAALNAVKLTDSSGNTWVGEDGAKTMKTSEKATSKWGEVTVVLDIVYTQGDTQLDASQVAQAWKAAINDYTGITLTAKDTTTYNGTNFSETDYDNTDGIQSATNYGLKFSLTNANATATYDNDADLQFASLSAASIQTQTFTIDGSDSNKGKCTIAGGTVYVGIWGIDDVEQHASDVYGLTIDVAVA